MAVWRCLTSSTISEEACARLFVLPAVGAAGPRRRRSALDWPAGAPATANLPPPLGRYWPCDTAINSPAAGHTDIAAAQRLFGHQPAAVHRILTTT